jgi:hypothetical protein
MLCSRESAAMMMEAVQCIGHCTLFEHGIWIEKSDEMAGGRGLNTRVRRRAGSMSLVRC